ncbi:adenylosuccinate lyase [Patescibacteria group bacterium]|nr:adenylosuccinate lyase [Patescibacteria group bacterium]
MPAIERYKHEGLWNIWMVGEGEARFHYWLVVEKATAAAQAQLGLIPKKASEAIQKISPVDPDKIKKEEEKTDHDLTAFLNVARFELNKLGKEESGNWLHYKLTSYDVEDTATSLMMRESIDILIKDLLNLAKIVKEKARKYKDIIEIGRTHGMHAEPITFGFKILTWLDQIDRQVEELKNIREKVSIGKISGAVGIYSQDPRVEQLVCKKLDLKPAKIATQIIPRDIYADYIHRLVVIGSIFERIATEIRNLARTEIAEVQEAFTATQTGSSAMPHKRNPHKSERIVGLSRVLRSKIQPMYENIATWHERDLTNSASERLTIGDATNLAGYMILSMTKIIEGLLVFPERMKENLEKTRGAIFSQGVQTLLKSKGMKASEAYEVVKKYAFEVMESNPNNLKSLLLKDKKVVQLVSEKDLSEVFNPKNNLRYLSKIFLRFK